jgi:N-acetylneuraminate synthase
MKKLQKLNKIFLIAEIGINHNGSIDLAKKLILLAKKYNFDCVKFQKRDLKICIPESHRNVLKETPWGNITYLQYKKKIEFSIKQYSQIDKFCKKIGIDWLVSSWDLNSQKEMRLFNCKYNKIASAMITNVNFLEMVAKEKKITFISTGMCDLKNVKKAVKIFKKHKCPFILMHCVSTYPCPEERLNLNLIKTYQKKFKCDVGYSGHESTVSPSLVAAMLGATVIERHITLDRSMWGTDQAASLQEEGLKNLTSVLSKIPSILGDGVKKFDKEEKIISKKFRYWEN